MDFYFMADAEIGKELGRRVKSLRLKKNWSQKEISQFTGISLNAIKSVEGGSGKILNLIKILRALKSLDHLDGFLPETGPSPMQMAKLQGRSRKRATGSRKRTPSS